MLDILVVDSGSETALGTCLSSIDYSLPITVNVLTKKENPTLEDTPGSTFNSILQFCHEPIFTIIDSNDFYLANALSAFLEFVPYKVFGLIYASSLHRRTESLNPYSELPLTQETVYDINPMRPPLFYNRKMVNYLQFFDNNTYYPEYDMSLKIWERFPVIHFSTPTISTGKRQYFNPEHLSDLETVIYNAKVRGTKQFYYAYPAMYPFGLMEPICVASDITR